MDFKIKRFVYLINDITNALLKQERVKTEEVNKNLRLAVIIVSIVLLISVILNIYLLVR